MDIKESKIIRETFVRHPWERARVRIATSLVSQYHGGIFRRVADIGCGDRYFLSEIALATGAELLAGVDTALSHDAAARINANFASSGLRAIVCGSAEEAAGYLGTADLILLMDVLEHVKDDSELLRLTCAALDHNGDSLILLTVPAFPGLMSAHDRHLGHLRRYDSGTLAECAERGGLRVLESGYLFFGLSLIRLVQCLLERLGFSQYEFRGVSSWGLGEGAAVGVSALLYAEFRLMRLLCATGLRLPGLSVYAICKK
jgi:SAM-dependent methyltransferase